jgi:hypothetical protein
MRKIFTLLVVAAVLLLAAYVAGYWPQRERMSALETEKASLQQRAEAAEAKVRAGQLLGELLTLKETVQEMNYGQARGLSSPFFEHARAEAGRTTDGGIKQALESIQMLRDPVTIALTQGDAAALSHLREAERRLRVALGYPAPPMAAAPTPAPSLAPGLPAPGPMAPTGAPPTPLGPGPNTTSPNPFGAATPTPTPTPTSQP